LWGNQSFLFAPIGYPAPFDLSRAAPYRPSGTWYRMIAN
jgi:hypothetical protein